MIAINHNVNNHNGMLKISLVRYCHVLSRKVTNIISVTVHIVAININKIICFLDTENILTHIHDRIISAINLYQ